MNVAVVGISPLAEQLIKTAKETGIFRPKAVYSEDFEKSTRFANEQDIKLIFNHIDELAMCEEVELVFVAETDIVDCNLIITLLQQGKHVLLDKQCFPTLNDWEDAVKVGEENHAFLLEMQTNLHTPDFHLLRESLGRTGKIRSVNFQAMQYIGRLNTNSKSKGKESALRNLGVLPLRIAVALFGKPTFTTYIPAGLDGEVDGGGTFALQYGDFVCTIVCSSYADSYGSNEIHGEEGNIIFNCGPSINKLEFVDRETKVCEPVALQQEKSDLHAELARVVELFKGTNQKEYQYLTGISSTVLRIMELAEQDIRRNQL